MKKRNFIRNAAICATATLPFICVKAQTPKEAPAAPKTPAAPTAPVAPKAPAAVDIWSSLPEVVATIGDQKITREDLKKEVSEMLKMAGGAQIPPAYIKQMLPQIINSIVDKRVLLIMAKEAGITPSLEMAVAEFDKNIKEMPSEQKAAFEKSLKAQGMTVEDLKKKVTSDPNTRKSIALDKYIVSNFVDKIKISDEDAQKYYDEHKAQFSTPAKVTASHILIKAKDNTKEADAAAKAKAEKILKEVEASPDKFGEIAEKESACPSGKAAKGNLGEFSKGQMVPEFEKAAFALEPNQICDHVVKTQFGYHVIKVTAKQPAKVKTFDEMKKQIKQMLSGQEAQKQIKEAIQKEKEKLKVKINV